MSSNPYEAPKADVAGEASPQAGAEGLAAALTPELEMRAMALLGQKRSRSAGISFFVSWAVGTPILAMVTGLVWAAVAAAILAGIISKSWVASQTPHLVDQVSAELGIPKGAFRPEQYLL
jgi:hypothetical protein